MMRLSGVILIIVGAATMLLVPIAGIVFLIIGAILMMMSHFEDLKSRLAELEELRNAGTITEEEYLERREKVYKSKDGPG